MRPCAAASTGRRLQRALQTAAAAATARRPWRRSIERCCFVGGVGCHRTPGTRRQSGGWPVAAAAIAVAALAAEGWRPEAVEVPQFDPGAQIKQVACADWSQQADAPHRLLQGLDRGGAGLRPRGCHPARAERGAQLQAECGSSSREGRKLLCTASKVPKARRCSPSCSPEQQQQQHRGGGNRQIAGPRLAASSEGRNRGQFQPGKWPADQGAIR